MTVTRAQDLDDFTPDQLVAEANTLFVKANEENTNLGGGIAKVAMGRRMATRLYWMWRNGCEYSPSFEFGSYAGQPDTSHGVK